MSTTLLLSQHSSNPLEVHSSDRHNLTYRRRYQSALKQAAAADDYFSSDDPRNGVNTSHMQGYHKHITNILGGPDANASIGAPTKPTPREPVFVDLDEGMDSDEEVGGVVELVDLGDDLLEELVDEEDLDADEDADGETDEEMTIHLKPPEEREEISEEIAELVAAVPQLTPDYKIIDRLGTGTFSSVYKAIDMGYHNKWDNSVWHGTQPADSSAFYQTQTRPPDTKVFVAVKRIYVTSGPDRIRNEISIMEDCRGCRHVSQLITAFRHEDQVVAVMPYHRNEDFRDFFRVLPLEGIKQYFRCLFRAFRDIHARKIIHRDVKPANFLFDPRTGLGTLVDFGLACRMEGSPALGACLHTGPLPTHPHGRVRQAHEYDIEQLKRAQRESRLKSTMPSDRVGYPEKDTRPHSKANRAGTRGFRAPEVLLKCGEQTGAIDMWSAGTILLFFLTGKFPLFQSSDDIEALMEVATIIGRRRMEKTATLHSRMFQSNIPSVTMDGISWREFVERQNPNLRVPRKPVPYYYPYSPMSQRSAAHVPPPPPPSSSSPNSHDSTTPPPADSSAVPPPQPAPPFSDPLQPPDEATYAAEIEKALDLVEQLMQPESVRRISPRKALSHPFLFDPSMDREDDEFFPHPFGQGVCGRLHFVDEVTDDLCVRVRVPGSEEMEVRALMPGEGIAIGRRPCEFHREEDGYQYGGK